VEEAAGLLILIEAKYVDGVLCIDIAKKEEAKMQSRQIEIK